MIYEIYVFEINIQCFIHPCKDKMSDHDSDDDYQDLVPPEENDDATENVNTGPKVNAKGIKVRGVEKTWKELKVFSTAELFRNSEIHSVLVKD